MSSDFFENEYSAWSYSGGDQMLNALQPVLITITIIYALLLMWSVANYILRSLSLYTVAKRRGISAPGVAWVPVGYLWTLGAIADNYDMTRNTVRKWRKILLWLAVSVAILYVLFFIIYFVVLFSVAAAVSYGAATTMEMFGPLFWMLLPLLLMSMAASALTVCSQICYYKLFESCDPKKAVLYLLLSLLVPFASPFCLMICRQKDEGIGYPPEMPERPDTFGPNNF